MTITTMGGVTPQRIDIELKAGEPVDFTVPVFDGTGPRTPTGWALVAKVKANASSPLLYAFNLLVVANGVRVAAPPADTADWADWPVAAARWDLWGTPPSGVPSPLAEGWVRVDSTIST